MRVTAKYALWLLPVLPFVQGCDHKAQTTQTQTLAPPIVDAPPPKPATVSTADLPPPVIGDAKPADSSNTAPPAEPPKKPVHHPKKPATQTPGTPTPGQDTASATPAPSPSVSAIGTLTGGATGDSRSQAEDLINITEKGVNGITRPLNDSETKTAAQIHEFLKQAREALTSGDVDGANTLAKKAKVLLAELNQ